MSAGLLAILLAGVGGWGIGGVFGKPLWCTASHDERDDGRDVVGQPLCGQWYDYTGHVLFTWWAPELWRRFTIAVRRGLRRELRRRGEHPDGVAVSFVKVVELQARGIPHYHAVIGLDAAPMQRDEAVAPPQTSISAAELAVLARAAAERVSLAVAGGDGSSRVLRFGEPMDTQPLTVGPTPTTAGDSSAEQGGVARRVAGYLAKYVTKSVAEFGLSPARISAEPIEALELRDHMRAILTTLVGLACTRGQYAPMLSWLHTLGYRAHHHQVGPLFGHDGGVAGTPGSLARPAPRPHPGRVGDRRARRVVCRTRRICRSAADGGRVVICAGGAPVRG